MPRSTTGLVVPALAAVLLAGCGAGGPSPSPEPQPSPPADASTLLRLTTVQALPPSATFGSLPWLVITLDGRALSGGAVPAIYPGPLVVPVNQRQLTPAGLARIVAAARAAGLLGGAHDFTGGAIPPGGQSARLELAADGRVFDLTGDPTRVMTCITTPCVPQPGSPEAFGGFLVSLMDLGSWLGAEIGQEARYAPAGYALLVGPPPTADANLPQPAIDWPLAGGFAAFGRPLADGSGGRCGTIVGGAAAAVEPALLAANQLSRWRDPSDGSFHGLVVQTLLPGDGDPCAGLA